MIRCTECGALKSSKEFYKNPHKRNGRFSACKACHKVRTIKDRAKDPSRWKVYGWRSRLKEHYGLDWKDYLALHEKQNGRCAICGRTVEEVPHRKGVTHLAVDHDHSTGALRGLLCNFCNRGLALFEDDHLRLAQAGEYLLKWQNQK